jgi:hypothetical protein
MGASDVWLLIGSRGARRNSPFPHEEASAVVLFTLDRSRLYVSKTSSAREWTANSEIFFKISTGPLSARVELPRARGPDPKTWPLSGIRNFLDQSQTLIHDSHLWSFFAAGDNRPDVYVGLIASSDLSPDHIPQFPPRPPPPAPRGELGDVVSYQSASGTVLHTLPVLKHGPNTACGGKRIINEVHPDETSCVQLGREIHGPTLCRDLAAPCGLTARYCPRLFAPKGP